MAPFDPNAAASPDSGIFGLSHSPEEAGVVLIPVPFEVTTSYGTGTSHGPAAVLEASRQVDLYDVDTGRPYEAGIAMLEIPQYLLEASDRARALAAPIIEAGGADETTAEALDRVEATCEEMNRWVLESSRSWLERGKRVGIIGGDHSVPFGSIEAHAERYPGMGILHLDAHADLRDAYEGFTWSHASIMHNVARRIPGVSKIVQVAVRDLCDEEVEAIERSEGRIVCHHDSALARARFDGKPWRAQVDEMVSGLPDDVYLSFDIDGLDPTLCPGTGTPVPGGLSFQETAALIEGVVRAGKRIVGFDLTEVAPGPGGGSWDGNVGARLLYKMIGWMLKSTEGASPERSAR